MPEELEFEEEGGLSTGAQLGIAAFFLGIIPLEALVATAGMGEAAFIVAALGAGSLGLGTKLLIDRHRPDDEETDDEQARASLSSRLAQATGLDRLQYADWSALLRPVGAPAPALLPQPKKNDTVLEVTSREIVEMQEGPDGLMHFGETLTPPVNSILSGRKALFGVSDAGKSNAIAVIVEEIGKRYGAALFLLDTEDEYRKLADKKYLRNPLWMEKSRLPVEKAFEFAQWAVHNLRQVVINLQSYEDHEAAWLMINLIKGVQAYEEAHEVRVPCEFILDEATVWLPQTPSQSTLNKVMVEDPDGLAGEDDSDDDDESRDKPKRVSLLTLLERAFFSVVVRRGRKRGMGFTLAAQRIAEINKSALQVNWMFLMKQTQAADFREYKKFGVNIDEIHGMLPGEAFVFAPGKQMEQHRFRLRNSPHGAKTPGWEELQRHQVSLAFQQTGLVTPEITMRSSQLVQHLTSPSNVSSASKQVEDLQSNPTIILPELEHSPSGRFTKSLSPELQKAYDFYQQGYIKSRTLASAMGIGKTKAAELLGQLRARKLISERPSVRPHSENAPI